MPPTTKSSPPDAADAPEAAYRLPRVAEPDTYRLTLAPDLAAATFTGSAEIELRITEPVTELVCNAAELTITDAVLTGADGSTRAAAVSFDEEAERVTFVFDGTVAAGPATLSCSFAGILNDKLRGFYKSTFVGATGDTKTIATTQMESTDARRAFPCWDEPDRKAVFEITLVIESGLAAFSNSPVLEETTVGTTRRLRFTPTMKMSTYLVAFVVGPMEATEPIDVDGVPLRVVHVPGKANLTAYALEVAAHSLRFFTGYFDIAYPGEKLDLVAIPDFAFGAMENLGCVTFRETALLVDPASAARTELERVALVVAHEIAHMWFGDLVTMQWWEGIWLNEAFATFMETICVDAFRPGWEIWVSFGVDREAAMALDDLHSTRPIEYPVGPPDEAEGMFDLLTYEKGGGVLRMLEQYLSPEVFRDGVRAYLAAHAYANTVTADLWRAIEEASGEPVRAVMDSWILQGGHPLVRVGEDAIAQEPFSYGPPPQGVASAIGQHWEVPVLVRTLEGEGDIERLLLGAQPISLPVAAGAQRLAVVNAGGSGAYRTVYEGEHLAQLTARLGELDALERFNLLADTWALVLAGQVSLRDFFALAGALGDEADPSTWTLVAGALGLCNRVVAETDRDLLEAADRALLGARLEAVGWDPTPGEGERIPTLRALLLGSLGTVGADPRVRAEAARRFDAASAADPLDANIEAPVLHTVASLLRPGDYDTILERYRHPATPQEEMRYLHTLATFPDTELTLRTFEMARTDEVRT